MKLTLVKKILGDGSPCKKCVEVQRRIDASGHSDRFHETLEADVRNPFSQGMLLASELGVDQAPFFVVTHPDGKREVFTSYFRFAKEILGEATRELDELCELMAQNPDLDYL